MKLFKVDIHDNNVVCMAGSAYSSITVLSSFIAPPGKAGELTAAKLQELIAKGHTNVNVTMSEVEMDTQYIAAEFRT